MKIVSGTWDRARACKKVQAQQIIRYRGGWCIPREIPWWAMSIFHEFPRKALPAGEKLPWWQLLVQIMKYFSAVLPYSALDINSGEAFSGSVCLITRGSIVAWGHAGDEGLAVFKWGCSVLPWAGFLVEVSSTTRRVWDIWRTQPVIRGCDGASTDNRCI